MSEMHQPVMLTAARRVHHPEKEMMCAKGLLCRCKQSGARILRSKFRLIVILCGHIEVETFHEEIGAAVWDLS